MKMTDQVEIDITVHEALLMLTGLQRAKFYYQKNPHLPEAEERTSELLALARKVRVFIFGEDEVAKAETKRRQHERKD